jgi:hypothetical protein
MNERGRPKATQRHVVSSPRPRHPAVEMRRQRPRTFARYADRGAPSGGGTTDGSGSGSGGG